MMTQYPRSLSRTNLFAQVEMECQSFQVFLGAARGFYSLYLLHHRDDPGRLLHREVVVAVAVGRPPPPLVHLLQHVDDLVESDGEVLHGAGAGFNWINSKTY